MQNYAEDSTLVETKVAYAYRIGPLVKISFFL